MKHIVLLSESIGFGHESAAKAIEEALHGEFQNIKITKANVLDAFQPIFAKVAKSIYINMLKTVPSLWGKWYERNRDKSWRGILRTFFLSLFKKELEKWLRSLHADVVVCTHPLSSFLVGELKQNGFEVPLCTVFTDFDLHGFWIHPKVDLYCVPLKKMEFEIRRKFDEDCNIQVTGIPISSKFSDRSLDEKNHDDGEKRILIMGGGLGIGVLSMIDSAIEVSGSSKFSIVCGNNVKLFRKLKNRYGDNPNVKIYGYTNQIQHLMAESDLLVTKPGGLTISEALTMKLPMMLYMPIRGQERRNGQLMEGMKVALASDDVSEMQGKLLRLLEDEQNRCEMENVMDQIRKPEAAREIAKLIMGLAI